MKIKKAYVFYHPKHDWIEILYVPQKVFWALEAFGWVYIGEFE